MGSYPELIRFVLQFMQKQKWVFLLIFLLDASAWPLDALVWPYILHVVIDIFTTFDSSRAEAFDVLVPPLLAGISLVAYVEVASRTMGFLLAKALPSLQAAIRMKMFDHIQHHSPHYFNERFAGHLANKLTEMTTQVELIIQQLFWPVIPALTACLFGTWILFSIHPLFALIFLAWLAIHLTACILFARPCDFYEQLHGEARSVLSGKIVDSFTNNFAVNLFFRFGHEKALVGHYQEHERQTNVRAKQCVEKMRTVLSLFYFVAVILGINGSLIYLWLKNQISTGEAIQVFTTMWNLTMILWTVGSALPVLFQAVGGARQAYSVMLDASDIQDRPGAAPLKVTAGKIQFDKVNFRYGERTLFTDKSITIKGGEKVGLVGYTGAGKSTFINLILRFFPLTSGRICIDGQDINDVTLESLRKSIALIPQDPILFHRSLADNILYGNPEAHEADKLEAARQAHCSLFIESLPQGYDAIVGERGTKLSGGERQRIAIARAILSKAPILLLDEATSALDSVTEQYIQDSLEKLMQGRTTIVIAHRLSTLARMDRILVFDRGKIVEEGPHESLLARNGLYAKMWKMQVGGFLPA
ncbi:ABC transporter ATP-binding protein [Estrella lausannensis]|uniref:ABC transporter ATP-binding protein n=1 Tax=Estrella lausannensis TaxID=483423 RepID=A0A0H5E4W4_9BACT|nr:ABC transporter ATP-binding protein [Estrella lausannensis]CRX38285.1 ABC transporter ATP-binding protein [Estrella lausannensis]